MDSTTTQQLVPSQSTEYAHSWQSAMLRPSKRSNNRPTIYVEPYVLDTPKRALLMIAGILGIGVFVAVPIILSRVL
jgi:hypothetical protein